MQLIYTNGIISYHDIYHIMMGHVLSVSSTVKKKMHILHHDTNIYCELLSDVQGRDGLGRDPRTFEWRSRSVIDGHGRNPRAGRRSGGAVLGPKEFGIGSGSGEVGARATFPYPAFVWRCVLEYQLS